VFLVRSVRAPRSGSPLAWRLAGYLRAASSSAHGPSGDLAAAQPTSLRSWAGPPRGRLRAQLGRVPLHVANGVDAGGREGCFWFAPSGRRAPAARSPGGSRATSARRPPPLTGPPATSAAAQPPTSEIGFADSAGTLSLRSWAGPPRGRLRAQRGDVPLHGTTDARACRTVARRFARGATALGRVIRPPPTSEAKWPRTSVISIRNVQRKATELGP